MIVWLTMPVEIREGQHVTDKVRLVRRLGGGGMGSVWAAEHTGLGQEVAVKFLDPELAADAALVERFWREAKAASQVKSAHVVHIYDFGVLEGEQPFIVMELLEGQDLADRAAAAGGRLPMHEVVTVVSQLARALARAHDKGIVHRDLKPANVFLCREAGDQMFVKLVDFGIAKTSRAAEELSRSTKEGTVLGTAYYMSPEQIRGDRNIDARSDLWSVGVLVYEVLTGAMPFDGETFGAVAMAIARGAPVPPSARVPDLPAAVDAWFARACAADPAARFQSAAELATELARACDEPLPAVTSSPELRAAPSVVPHLAKTALEAKTQVTMTSPASPQKKSPALYVAIGVAALIVVGTVVAYARLRTPDGASPTASRAGSSTVSAASSPTDAPTPLAVSATPPPTAVAEPRPSATTVASPIATGRAPSSAAASASASAPAPTASAPAVASSGPRRPKDIF
ncbi:MAG: protein kinase [Myxococcales bacterium]|nr:protein kinase [Myxococcales bacterium]